MAMNAMDTMGSRLEEARKRKGVSLREAAEATKIRSEYLSQFESDDFDIPLPEIYQRGFVKIYARYLGEDPDEFGKLFQSRLNRMRSQPVRSEVRASLGQLDVASRRKRDAIESGEPEPEEEEAPRQKPRRQRWKVPSIRKPELQSAAPAEEPEYDDFEEDGDLLDKDFYIKVAMIVGSVTVAVILVIILVRLIVSDGSSDTPDMNPELADDASAAEVVGSGSGDEVREITLRATGGNTYFRVVDAESRERLDGGTLNAGQSRNVAVNGPVNVMYTLGEHLEVVKGSETFAPSRPGAAQIRIP